VIGPEEPVEQSTRRHPDSGGAIVFFDGVCNLCNGSVQFIIARDPSNYFRFASLQSAAAERLLAEHGYDAGSLSSVILLENGRMYERSTAALRIARRLAGGWWMLSVFTIVPRGVRDAIYEWIASNRYRWFGRRDECMIPTPEMRSRFVDG
jgi:predicted DCC family thiol-disulfide oxidoreductase YuxK